MYVYIYTPIKNKTYYICIYRHMYVFLVRFLIQHVSVFSKKIAFCEC